MPDTPTQIPAQLTAGDTARWQRSHADYPASAGWGLTYYLVKSGTRISFSSSASGDDHLVNVAAATTAGWTAGSYDYQECAVNGAQRYTLAAGRITILPDFAGTGAASGLDARSHARKTLDVIEAWLENRANWAAEFSIAGRQVRHIPVNELLMLRDRYRADVRREEQAARVAQGLPAGNRILTRFG